jgi:integrase
MGRPRKDNQHLPRYVTVNHGSYYYKPPGETARRICPVGDDQALYKFMLERSTPAGPISTMRDCFDRYEREVVPALAPRTQKDYRKALKLLRATFGHMAPNDILPRDVGRFLDVPTGKIHRVRIVAVLSAVFGYAVGSWYVADRNPCRDVKRPKGSKRNRYVTDAEYQAVYALASPRVKVAMDLALLTGQRQGDLLELKWEQVTPEGVLFTQGKTGKRLLVGMSPSLEDALGRAKRFLPHLPREYVLRQRNGKAYRPDGFRAIWQRTMNKATKGDQPVLKERYTFHDLRAKCVSDTVNLQDAMERAGHTSMAMTRGVYDRGIRKVTPLK